MVFTISEVEIFRKFADVFKNGGGHQSTFWVDGKIVYCNLNRIEFSLFNMYEESADIQRPQLFIMPLHFQHYVTRSLAC